MDGEVVTLPSRERIEEMQNNLRALVGDKRPEEVYFETRADWIAPLLDAALVLRRLEPLLLVRNPYRIELRAGFSRIAGAWEAQIGDDRGYGPDLLSALLAALDKAEASKGVKA